MDSGIRIEVWFIQSSLKRCINVHFNIIEADHLPSAMYPSKGQLAVCVCVCVCAHILMNFACMRGMRGVSQGGRTVCGICWLLSIPSNPAGEVIALTENKTSPSLDSEEYNEQNSCLSIGNLLFHK